MMLVNALPPFFRACAHELPKRLAAAIFFLLFGAVTARADGDLFRPPADHNPVFQRKLNNLSPAGTAFPDYGKLPQDVVTGDWNRDGYPDLAIAYAQDDEVRWFFGAANGSFQQGGHLGVGVNSPSVNGATNWPRRLAAADFDDDGLLDLAVLCSGYSRTGQTFFTPPSFGILYGKPAGGFEPFQPIPLWPEIWTGPQPKFATSLAMINDSILAIGFMDSHQIAMLAHLAGRQWAQPRIYSVSTSGSGPVELALADLDCDGQTDLVVMNWLDIQVWQGNAAGGFGSKSALGSGKVLKGLALADFNQDGAWDAAYTDGLADTLTILMGLTSAGAYQQSVTVNVPAGSGPGRLIRSDFNLDGRDDLEVVFLAGGGGQVLTGQESPTDPLAFATSFQTASQPCALACDDFNRDGWPDLAVVNQGDPLNPDNQDLSLILSGTPADSTPRIALRNYTDPGLSLSPWLARPRGLGWDGSQNALWTIDRRRRALVRLGQDGAIKGVIPLNAISQINAISQVHAEDPVDVAIDGGGDAWLADRLGGRLLRLGTSGDTAVRQGFPTTAAGLPHPSGVAFDPLRGRLLVADESQPLLVAFSMSGLVQASYTLDQPMRDLAWDTLNDCPWGIPESAPGQILRLALDDSSGVAGPVQVIPLDSLAPILKGQTIRSIAINAAAGCFWVLTDSGAVVQSGLEPKLMAIHELSLLRRELCAANEPTGTMLVADGGPLSTVFRLNASANAAARYGPGGSMHILESFALCAPGDAPLHVDGLARADTRIYMLDGNQGKILVFDPHGKAAGSVPLSGLKGRRPHGLAVDADLNCWTTTLGRLLEFNSSGKLLTEYRLPTTTPPTALAPGAQAGELAVLSARAGSIMIVQGGINPPGLKQVLLQTVQLAAPFHPLAALVQSTTPGNWRLLVAEEDEVILAGQENPFNAVGRGWQYYR